MRIQKLKTKKSLILIIAALLVLFGVVAYLFILKPHQDILNERPENTVNYDKPSSSQKQAGQDAKESFIEKHENDENQTTENIGQTSNVVVTITSYARQDELLQIRTIIEQTKATGVCKLVMTMDSRKVVKEVDSRVLGSYSVCRGFDVPISELAPGMWNTRVDFKSDYMSGSAQREVEVK